MAERQIVMTSVERGLMKRMGQVMDERRINPEMDTFTANDMARAIRAATGVPVNYRELRGRCSTGWAWPRAVGTINAMLAFTMALPDG